jgi:hypothetical protein
MLQNDQRLTTFLPCLVPSCEIHQTKSQILGESGKNGMASPFFIADVNFAEFYVIIWLWINTY